jgi:hypothetical protein
MKKSSALRIVLFIIVFVSGGLIGVFVASYQYYKVVFRYYAASSQADLYKQLMIVSHIHLNEIEKASALLDADIDAKILDVASPEFTYNTENRDRVLIAARTYRKYFPSRAPDANEVTIVLADYPAIEKFDDNSSLSRLIKQLSQLPE